MTNPSSSTSGAGSKLSYPEIFALSDGEAQQKQIELRALQAALLTEENAKRTLTLLGMPTTPAAVKTFIEGGQTAIARANSNMEKTFAKKAEKEMQRAENKQGVVDLTKVANATIYHVNSTPRTLGRIETGSVGVCSGCEKSAMQLRVVLKKCGRCKDAMYCSQACQTAHWPTHKTVCKVPSRASSQHLLKKLR